MALVILLAIYVIGWLIVYSYPQLRALVRGRHARGVLIDSENLACLRLPPGWRSADGLSAEPAIQILIPLRNVFFTITSHSKDDLDPSLDLLEYAALMRQALSGTGRMIGLRGPDECEVAGFRAVRYEMDLLYEHFVFTYLQTAIDGRRARHQAVGWTYRSRYDRARFERLLAGFAEAPGPDPNPVTASFPTMVEPPASRQQVH